MRNPDATLVAGSGCGLWFLAPTYTGRGTWVLYQGDRTVCPRGVFTSPEWKSRTAAIEYARRMASNQRIPARVYGGLVS